ncbi:hypothetical protein [Halococcus salifodinae]|nr:hypothetical protein [Halococcus salifodinae]
MERKLVEERGGRLVTARAETPEEVAGGAVGPMPCSPGTRRGTS